MAQGFESLNELSGGAGRIEVIEVIVAQFSVGCIRIQHLE